MLRRVRIRGYKSLRDVEVRFERPLTVIMGANAAGKSNLFDVLALSSRMATGRTLREAFDKHRGNDLEAFTYGNEGLAGLLKKDVAEFSIDLDLELSQSTIDDVERQIARMREGLTEPKENGKDTGHTGKAGQGGAPSRHIVERFFRYSLTVQITTEQGYLRVVNERLAALNSSLEERKSRNAFIERVNSSRGEPKLSLRQEGQAHPTYFDVGLDYTVLSTPLYLPHYPHMVAVREELSRWQFYYLEPQAMREQVPLRNVRTLGVHGADLAAFFNTMKAEKPKQFDALRRALHRLIPNLEAFDVERTPDGFLQVSVRENDTEYSSRVISEGTLRILALLAITNPLTPTTLIGFEEPENGVHPHRLELIAQLLHDAAEMRDVQILVNTHSPLLPRHFPDDELVLCRRQGATTVFERIEAGLWSDPTLMEERLNANDYATSFTEQIERGDYGG